MDMDNSVVTEAGGLGGGGQTVGELEASVLVSLKRKKKKLIL